METWKLRILTKRESIRFFSQFSLRLKVEEFHWSCDNDAPGKVKLLINFIILRSKLRYFDLKMSHYSNVMWRNKIESKKMTTQLLRSPYLSEITVNMGSHICCDERIMKIFHTTMHDSSLKYLTWSWLITLYLKSMASSALYIVINFLA